MRGDHTQFKPHDVNGVWWVQFTIGTEERSIIYICLQVPSYQMSLLLTGNTMLHVWHPSLIEQTYMLKRTDAKWPLHTILGRYMCFCKLYDVLCSPLGPFIPPSSLYVQTFTQRVGKSVLKPRIVSSNLKMLTDSVLNSQLQIHYLSVTSPPDSVVPRWVTMLIKRHAGAVSGSSHGFYTIVDHKLAFSLSLKTWLPNLRGGSLLTPNGEINSVKRARTVSIFKDHGQRMASVSLGSPADIYGSCDHRWV